MSNKIDSMEVRPDSYNGLARGRNGIFKPKVITIVGMPTVIRFELLSQRAGRTAPIFFETSPDEARQFAGKILAVLPENGKETK